MTSREDLGPRSGAGARTAAEIFSQPQIWPKAVAVGAAAIELQQCLAAGPALYTGCGSTGHLARALAINHRQSLPTFAWAETASEFWLNSIPDAPWPQTVVAVSRSGETTETIKACKRAESAGSTLVAVTASPGSTLDEISRHSVIVDFASEESVVQTRSFTSMLLAALAAQMAAAGRDAVSELGGIGATGAALISDAESAADRLSDTSLTSFYVLGSGFDRPLACEAALKIKEMSSTLAEGIGILDFRHGPISLADEKTAVLVLCGAGLAHELAVTADIEACGARVITVGPDPRCTIESPRDAHELETAVARLVVPQITGLRRGIAKGLDPDAPDGVSACIELEPSDWEPRGGDHGVHSI